MLFILLIKKTNHFLIMIVVFNPIAPIYKLGFSILSVGKGENDKLGFFNFDCG